MTPQSFQPKEISTAIARSYFIILSPRSDETGTRRVSFSAVAHPLLRREAISSVQLSNRTVRPAACSRRIMLAWYIRAHECVRPRYFGQLACARAYACPRN